MTSIKQPMFVAVAAFTLSLLAVHSGLLAQDGRSNEHWVGTWTTAEVGRPQTPPVAPQAPPAQGQNAASAPAAPAPFLHFNNQTLRQIVHTSIGGTRARVVLSNRFGTAPLTIGAAHMAVRSKDAAIVPSSDRRLTFSGRPTITIPSGATVYSNPVDLTVPPLADIAIDLYVPGDTNTSSPLTTFGWSRHETWTTRQAGLVVTSNV